MTEVELIVRHFSRPEIVKALHAYMPQPEGTATIGAEGNIEQITFTYQIGDVRTVEAD